MTPEAYAEAMRLVGARQSKGALVALVNWMLVERDEARARADAAEAETVRGIVAGMRCGYPMNKHAQEWAGYVERGDWKEPET